MWFIYIAVDSQSLSVWNIHTVVAFTPCEIYMVLFYISAEFLSGMYIVVFTLCEMYMVLLFTVAEFQSGMYIVVFTLCEMYMFLFYTVVGYLF